jgi:capsular polysaccharide biosynthesis protein
MVCSWSDMFSCNGSCLSTLYPNVYQTSAKIKILDDKNGGMDLSEMTSMFSGSQVNLYNEMEVLRSHRLLERVVTDLDLTTSYYFMANVMTPEIWGDKPFNIVSSPKTSTD